MQSGTIMQMKNSELCRFTIRCSGNIAVQNIEYCSKMHKVKLLFYYCQQCSKGCMAEEHTLMAMLHMFLHNGMQNRQLHALKLLGCLCKLTPSTLPNADLFVVLLTPQLESRRGCGQKACAKKAGQQPPLQHGSCRCLWEPQ